jgi:signal transduction histidine kinase
MKFNSLNEKLVLYFVLLGILVILVISAISFYGTKSALMSRTFDQLTSLRVVKKNQISQFYTDRARDIVFLAAPTPFPFLKRKEPSAVYRSLYEYFSAFYIINGSGLVVKGNFDDKNDSDPPDISNQVLSALREQLNHRPVVITDMAVDEISGKPYQLIATNIHSGDSENLDTTGMLVLNISIEKTNTIMLNTDSQSGLGLSGETYLVGPDFLMRSTSRFQPGSVLKTNVRTKSVESAMKGETGTIITPDYRNIPVLSSYDKIEVPGLSWVILAEIDLQEAMVPIYEMRTRILLLSIIMTMVFFGFVFFLARRITRPLVGLNNAVIRLGEGHYDIELRVYANDEIGMLTKSFNTMARQIKEKTTELQQERLGRMRSVIDGEEMERQRLSRELHDGIGQLLIAIKLRMESLLYQNPSDIKNSIQELKKYFDQIIDEVRRISNNLMPSVLEAFGPAIAFRNLFADTEELSGLRIHFEAKGDFDNLDKKNKTYIYRLTQEAISNIVKHAEAQEVWVNLTRKTDLLTLVIRDDGKGFIPELAGAEGGNGIHNMRERVSLLHGQIIFKTSPGKGTTITVNIPTNIPYVSNQDFPRG